MGKFSATCNLAEKGKRGSVVKGGEEGENTRDRDRRREREKLKKYREF
jgi:hypothetical protein